MTLSNFLNLVPDTHDVHLVFDGFELHGKQDAIGCMLSEAIYKGIVTDVEAEDDVLKVWAKEGES